jgi:hypothetical protein
MSEFTPGPWEYLDDAFRPVYRIRNLDEPRIVVGQATSAANARLIAAAPELLEALYAASHALKSYAYGNSATLLAMETAEFVDDAIAKATQTKG